VAGDFKPRLKYAFEALQANAEACGFKRAGLFGGVIVADDQLVFLMNWAAVSASKPINFVPAFDSSFGNRTRVRMHVCQV